MFQLGKADVGGVGLCPVDNELFPVEAEKFLGVGDKKAVAEHDLRRIIEFLMIQPVNTAEIRNAALGGHTCTAEKYDIRTVCDPFLKPRLLFVHKNLLIPGGGYAPRPMVSSGGGNTCVGSWSSRRSRSPACP